MFWLTPSLQTALNFSMKQYVCEACLAIGLVAAVSMMDIFLVMVPVAMNFAPALSILMFYLNHAQVGRIPALDSVAVDVYIPHQHPLWHLLYASMLPFIPVVRLAALDLALIKV